MIGRVAGGHLGEVGRDTQNSRGAKNQIATNRFGTWGLSPSSCDSNLHYK
jgi:hypothetical protein